MSRNGSLLALEPAFVSLFVDRWNQGYYASLRWPRSGWLKDFELHIASKHPSASRASLNLTARHYAPFPLAAGHDVP